MSAIWFYQPAGLLERVGAAMLHRRFVHVSIQHAVSNVSVVTEAHPWLGIYCMPVSRMREPSARVLLEIPDVWITEWLVKRWGVRFTFLDAIRGPSGVAEAKRVTLTSAELVSELIQDAIRAGQPIPPIVGRPSTKPTPSVLADLLKVQ